MPGLNQAEKELFERVYRKHLAPMGLNGKEKPKRDFRKIERDTRTMHERVFSIWRLGIGKAPIYQWE